MTTASQIRKSLNEQLDAIRGEISDIGYTLRNLRFIDGDTDYAEWEVIGVLCERTDWDGWEDYDEITTSELFKRVVKYQAAFNVNA